MSNEITLNLQLKVQNPYGSTTGYQTMIQQTRLLNQNSLGASAEIVTVPNAATNYAFSNLATPGITYLQNLDSTYAALFGAVSGGTFYPIGMVEATEVALFRLLPNTTYAMQAGLPAPPLPAPTQTTTGGTVAAGTYKVEVTYVNASGETAASAQATVTTSTGTSTITIPSPAASGGGLGKATGWYAYVSQAGGSTLTRQQTLGSPTAIGTGLTLTAPPTNSGANPPSASSMSAIQISYLVLSD